MFLNIRNLLGIEITPDSVLLIGVMNYSLIVWNLSHITCLFSHY